MMGSILNIDDDKLNVLFPFHLLFNSEGKILRTGKSNHKLFGDINQRYLQEVFEFKRPSMIHGSNSFKELYDQVIILESKLLNGLMYRGQLLEWNEGSILFAGSPWMTDVNDLDKFNLNIADFAIHNTITDMMEILNSNQMVMNDITELVGQLSLQKSELNNINVQLITLIENLQSGILVEDMDRNIVITNQSFCNIFMIPMLPNQLKGFNCDSAAQASKDLFLNFEEFLIRVNEILREKKIVTNEIIHLKDGTILERDFIPIQYEDGKSGNLWQYKDVTIQKRSELQIKHNEEKFRSVIENLKLGLIEVDIYNRITKVYPQFCELTGYTENELIGKNSNDLLLENNDKETISSQDNKRIIGESGVYDLKLKKKNGEFIWVTVSGAPIYDVKNQVTGSIGINLNITERKEKEEEYKRAKEVAEESVRTKQQFLSNVSHEIRTPLNVIIGMSELMMNSVKNSEQREDIHVIRNSANHLLSIINDILDLAKIESGKQTVNSNHINIRSLVKQQMDIQNMNAKFKGLKLHYSIDPSIPEVLVVDETKLNQVLTNLINNAIKFTDKGFVLLELKCEKRTDDQLTIHFSVSDTGIGIPENKLSAIFESFTQANNHYNNKHAGTGLGLAIVKNIVEICGGSIWVESELRRGSTFHVTLPFKIGQKEKPETNSDEEQERMIRNKHVLIVEDNKLNQVVARRILENWGCKTSSAMNGLEALDLLKERKFDLILMDIQMPEMDGFETAKHIRLKYKLTTPIIAMTAYSNSEIIQECKQSGMNEVVSKPFKKSILKKKIFIQLQNWTEKQSKIDISCINSAYLEELTLNDPQLLNDLIEVFVEEGAKSIESIRDGISKKDKTSLKAALHKYRSSVRTFQFEAIDKLIGEVESLLLAEDWEKTIFVLDEVIFISESEIKKLKQMKHA